MAMILEGLPRNAGTHAGGLVISPKNLSIIPHYIGILIIVHYLLN